MNYNISAGIICRIKYGALNTPDNGLMTALRSLARDDGGGGSNHVEMKCGKCFHKRFCNSAMTPTQKPEPMQRTHCTGGCRSSKGAARL